eukprot:2236732-Rhodomonas_salina.1
MACPEENHIVQCALRYDGRIRIRVQRTCLAKNLRPVFHRFRTALTYFDLAVIRLVLTNVRIDREV